MICEMDGYMRNYAALTKELYPESNLDTPGAGAAGAWLRARCVPARRAYARH